MRYEIELLNRYKDAFGYLGRVSEQYTEGIINRGLFTTGIAVNEALIGKHKKGQPDFQVDCFASHFNFADLILSIEGENFIFAMTGEKSQLVAPPPMMSFKRSKKTKITVIDRSDENEIIEDFGLQSWEIDINGIAIDMEKHEYPRAALKSLNRIFNYRGIISASSPLFSDMGINAIWLEDQNFDFVEGYPDTLKYSFTAHSIKPVEINLINKCQYTSPATLV